jgi:hypothetical protein
VVVPAISQTFFMAVSWSIFLFHLREGVSMSRLSGASGYLTVSTYQHLSEPQFNYVRSLLLMAGLGTKFDFHGSYTDKAEAVKKEKEVGGFIRERTVKGKVRYFVLTVKIGGSAK